MQSILSPLLSFVLAYKYAAVAFIVYSGAVILPLPVNAVLLGVGAFASQGYFNIWILIPLAVGMNTLGDLTDYWLTRYFGEPLVRLLRLHKFKFYEQLQEELRTDAAVTVFITGFAGSLSPVGSFLAGMVGVPFKTFFFFDLLGNIIEPGAALIIGYAVGDYWSDFSSSFDLFAGVAAVAIVLFVLARIYHRMMKRHNLE